MRSEHRGFTGLEGVPECLVGDMRDVHEHAQAVHFSHDVAPEISEAFVMFDVRTVDVAG